MSAFWNSPAQHADRGYTRQQSVTMPYVSQQKCLNK